MSVLMSVASAFPHYSISSEETKEFLGGYVNPPFLEACRAQVDASGIVTRRSLGALQQLMRMGGIESRNARYTKEAIGLGVRAATAALNHAGVSADEVGMLMISSSTGYMMPSLADHLALQLRLRPCVDRIPLTGLGCSGSIRGLTLAANSVGQAQRRGPALVVSVELPSLWLQPEEPSPEDVSSALTFGDGAAAVVVDATESVTGAEMLTSETILWPGTLNARGAILTSTGFRHVAPPTLPLRALRQLRPALRDFLARARVCIGDLHFVAANPRNERFLAALTDVLSLPSEFARPARYVWRTRGNMLSVGLPYVLEVLQRIAPPAQGDTGLVVVLGPGVSCDLMLLRWNGEVRCGSVEA